MEKKMRSKIFFLIFTLFFFLDASYGQVKKKDNAKDEELLGKVPENEKNKKCNDYDVTESMWRNSELKIAKKFPQIVSRPSVCELKIFLKNGKIKSYKSNRVDDSYLISEIYESMPYALVKYSMWYGEYISYVLINLNSGTESHIEGIPVLNSTLDYFAFTVDGGDMGNQKDGVSVWFCPSKDLECKSAYELWKEYRGVKVKWLKPTRAEFKLAKGNEGNEIFFQLIVNCDKGICRPEGSPRKIK
jgi:hypothetical protein